MQDFPLISVITTYYNSVQLGDFVKSSMNCLLNQTYPNIEFICVNDGSTDSTLEDLLYFEKKDSRVKVYTKKNQKYAQYSKAYGQEKAKGEFIFLFDHDDLIDLNTIEKCYQTFQKHPDLDIVTPIVITKFTDGKVKSIHNIYSEISLDKPFEYRQFSGKKLLADTVGRYDIHIRGLYRNDVFKSHSFAFTEPLLNADEIAERFILEEANMVGNCDAIYTHYIHPDSSAKLLSVRKTDITRTDFLLRQIFKEKKIYEPRKSIFELVAYKNFINAVKIFHHFSDKMSCEEKATQKKRLLESYKALDKQTVKSQFKGIKKIYNSFLLSSFSFILIFYKFKN
ncbi:glycosyltransferase family A protein [Chryseobacterium zhengzhouense]|uniref:Glycosyltransferase family A protein n=1 Tax=Chryseobacterium zhengzhouense TaxID=1636086 RepID=A0ABW2M132_9FLAO